jgi:hypothetical protein
MEVARRLRITAMLPRLRRLEEEQAKFADDEDDSAHDTVVLQQVAEAARELERPTAAPKHAKRPGPGPR